VLDGSCRTPIGAHAVVESAMVRFRGLIARPDGSAAHDIAAAGQRADAIKIGEDCARALKQRAGANFFD
jgi:hydroxymethylbilane synthase